MVLKWAWKIDSAPSVQQALIDIGQTLEILGQHQLLFNPRKTVMLVRLEGSQAARTTKQFLVRAKEGLFAKIPRINGGTLLPVVHSHTYLGRKLSYHCFETLTVNHRMQITPYHIPTNESPHAEILHTQLLPPRSCSNRPHSGWTAQADLSMSRRHSITWPISWTCYSRV